MEGTAMGNGEGVPSGVVSCVVPQALNNSVLCSLLFLGLDLEEATIKR